MVKSATLIDHICVTSPLNVKDVLINGSNHYPMMYGKLETK